MGTTDCKICHKWFNNYNELTRHIWFDHKLGIQSYYDTYVKQDKEGLCKTCGKPTVFRSCSKGYDQFCSKSCAKLYKVEDTPASFNCEICNQTIEGNNVRHMLSKFATHLRKEHGIYEPKIYYDQFRRKDNEGKCPICGKPTKFISVMRGYETYCSTECRDEGIKRDNNSHNTKLHLGAILKEQMKKIADTVTEKYRNFLKNDKKIGWSDIREQPLKRENFKDTSAVDTIDGDKVEVKTEISMTNSRDPWTGTQTRYVPKMENCHQNPYFDEIIDDGNTLDETEWCR